MKKEDGMEAHLLSETAFPRGLRLCVFLPRVTLQPGRKEVQLEVGLVC